MQVPANPLAPPQEAFYSGRNLAKVGWPPINKVCIYIYIRIYICTAENMTLSILRSMGFFLIFFSVLSSFLPFILLTILLFFSLSCFCYPSSFLPSFNPFCFWSFFLLSIWRFFNYLTFPYFSLSFLSLRCPSFHHQFFRLPSLICLLWFLSIYSSSELFFYGISICSVLSSACPHVGWKMHNNCHGDMLLAPSLRLLPEDYGHDWRGPEEEDHRDLIGPLLPHHFQA